MDENPYLAYLRSERDKCASARASLESGELLGVDPEFHEALIPFFQGKFAELTAAIEAEEARNA